METKTLEGESGAKQAVAWGLIGEEVEVCIIKPKVYSLGVNQYASSVEWVKKTLTFEMIAEYAEDWSKFKIKVPKPSIESLRVGDVCWVICFKGDKPELGKVVDYLGKGKLYFKYFNGSVRECRYVHSILTKVPGFEGGEVCL